MELPDSATSEDNQPPRTITVSIDQESTLYVDGEQISWEQLPARARAFAAEETEPRAIIAVDCRVSHGEFIRIVDILREARITRYAINVNPGDREAN